MIRSRFNHNWVSQFPDGNGEGVKKSTAQSDQRRTEELPPWQDHELCSLKRVTLILAIELRARENPLPLGIAERPSDMTRGALKLFPRARQVADTRLIAVHPKLVLPQRHQAAYAAAQAVLLAPFAGPFSLCRGVPGSDKTGQIAAQRGFRP